MNCLHKLLHLSINIQANIIIPEENNTVVRNKNNCLEKNCLHSIICNNWMPRTNFTDTILEILNGC